MSARDVVAKTLTRHVSGGVTADAWKKANCVLSALAAAGYEVVPREPTTDMLQDGQAAGRKARRAGVSGMTIDSQVRAECAVESAIYRAMLTAAAKEWEG